ncbi:hypothetical protein [Jannaschia sp. CCS1]|uniref:hypothetical protein n=1 Tax=Jannaschia sp. (strain CCS1) TaxID=290400 RepID=UPI000053CFBC|nr:hypothetical protein [Jannaschia sp. CCS1]ABD53156.1 hypothetical protein Jann_0239 [Jannaschia sp. CCS1]
MTVCVAVKVQDCIVFAADSTTSLQAVGANGEHVTMNTYDHANKLFNLRKGCPVAAMTAGIGNFGGSSISTVSKDFRSLIDRRAEGYALNWENYTIEEIVGLARKYFFEERFSSLSEKPQGSFQYWVGGYSSGEQMGEVWQFQIHNGECLEPQCSISRNVASGLAWGGAPEAINRLILGYGQRIGDALVEGGLDASLVPQAIDGIARYTQCSLVHAAMPTGDAIDLAKFLAETTKQFVRFMPGSNSVGGDLDIATITKHENFKWIARKHFYNTRINPLETNHA